MGEISEPGGFGHRECFGQQRINPATTAQPAKSVLRAKGAPEGVHLAGGEELGSPSNPRAVLQQPHHHAALVVLTTKEHGQHLDLPLLSACTKPSHGTIKSQVAKAREEIIV
jgi:hypothetical protein